MAKSKLVKANEKIAENVVGGYKKIEEGVVGGYKKIENGVVGGYRKYHSPVISAARKVSLAAALVSMLSLETAMLSQFDTESTSPYFRQFMTGSTGAGICTIIVGMGIFMMIHSARRLR